jgi:hypothetical protein
MKITWNSCFGVFAFALASQLCVAAGSQAFNGVWKADVAKSHFEGPAPQSELLILEQSASEVKQIVSETNQRGEYRSAVTYRLDGKESENSYRGLPMKSNASLQGDKLTVESKVAGPHTTTIHQDYQLSADGKTLEVTIATNANGKDTSQKIVFDKQPEAPSESLLKPEQKAGEKYKNVKLLADLPASRFVDTMRYFTASLGVNCGFCHVEGKFDSDEKEEKRTARTMLTMVHNINQQTFDGHQEVRCYTCHRGNKEPLRQIPFE